MVQSLVRFGGVGLSKCFFVFAEWFGPASSGFKEAIVRRGVFEAWREPCSIRCCGEIAVEVGWCNRWSDFGGVGLSKCFFDFAEWFGPVFLFTRAHRSGGCV